MQERIPIEINFTCFKLIFNATRHCVCFYSHTCTLSTLSQCTSLKTHSRFGLLLRPSSGSVIQNSTKNDTW